MKKSLFLLALLCASTACRSADEHAASPPPAQGSAVAAAPIVPPKKEPAAQAGAVPAVPAVPAQPPKGDAVAALPLVPPATPASDASAPVTPETRSERFEALQKEFDAAMNAYYDLFRNAKSEEEMQEVAKTAKAPDTAPYFARANALLDEDAADETALSVIQWMFDNARDDAQSARLCGLLERHHFEKEGVGDLLRNLANAGPAGAALLDRLSEKSPHESVRGRALYQRADLAMQDRRFASELKTMPDGEEKDSYKGYLGEERFAKLMQLDLARAEQDALALFLRVQKEYGAVKLRAGTPYETTLADAAAANVFEIQNLAVGKPAPDIAGEDVAGVAFKLSDYRGKVVMLDFWGFW